MEAARSQNQLDELRESLNRIARTAIPGREIAPGAARPKARTLATGYRDLDRLLAGGGLPMGRITELAGALALSLAAGQTRSGALVAYIDGKRQLFPPAAAALGVDLTRFLVITPPRERAPIARAAEILARSRAFALIIIDLPERAAIGRSLCARLSTATRGGAAVVLALSSRGNAIESAAARLSVRPLRGSIPRQVGIEIGRGAESGFARTAIELGRAHLDEHPPAPLPSPIRRRPPGEESNP
jgi:recombination protein RecA